MLVSSSTIHDEAVGLTDQVVADRRHFHRHPELGFQEHQTAAYVAERLRKLGVDEVQTGVAQTGVVGIIRGPASGRVVLLRADMDALPLTEATGAPYASENPGVHHACGHDGHTAILLSVAELLMRHRDELSGTVKLVFQPAEEGPGGAKPMIEAGVMDSPRVDACFGLHLSNNHPVGTMIAQGGAMQASADEFTLIVEGVGGHGAAPHQTVDPIAVGSAIVAELQRIVSREIDPLDSAVITVGEFHSGTRLNIIPQRAELRGTIRSLRDETQQFLHQRIREVATGVASAARATCDVRIDRLYPVTVNDEEMAAFAHSVAETIVPPEQVIFVKPIMGAEDMSFFLRAAPGCFVFLGSANKERNLHHPHHGPYFDFDEAALPLGIELLTKLAMTYLERP
ncbi:MAG: N-acyl-L-amino acid amidohydrolase [Ktedonobacterales bacterium]|jgi:amidohydrolase|nr:MAG: N-acyl-L-amino acid amidohydrolase [Ktedonobacterales bacterium]